jgi:hypothetical protein
MSELKECPICRSEGKFIFKEEHKTFQCKRCTCESKYADDFSQAVDNWNAGNIRHFRLYVKKEMQFRTACSVTDITPGSWIDISQVDRDSGQLLVDGFDWTLRSLLEQNTNLADLY